MYFDFSPFLRYQRPVKIGFLDLILLKSGVTGLGSKKRLDILELLGLLGLDDNEDDDREDIKDADECVLFFGVEIMELLV